MLVRRSPSWEKSNLTPSSRNDGKYMWEGIIGEQIATDPWTGKRIVFK
jgi:hypothetical protein